MLRSRLPLTAVALALVLAGCSSAEGGDPVGPTPTEVETQATTPPESPSEQRRGGSLRFALTTDPESIDPRFVADDEGSVVVDALFDSLVALDGDLQVVPAAAESWELSEDGRRFVFTLREGAMFHDGETPVTAHDFARTFTRIASGAVEPRSFLSFQLEPIVGFPETQQTGEPLAGVEAVDDLTLRISLNRPFPEFLQVLARPSLGPVPPVADELPDAFAEKPIGNGPFKMVEPWQRNQFIRVARFDGYAGEPAYLDEVVFRVYANDAAQEIQYTEFANGQLQFAEVPASKRKAAIEQFGLSGDGYSGPGVLDGLSTTIYYYGFNLERPPFDDPEVRRALSLSIDRERIAREIMRETRVPADAVVPPSIPGSQAATCGHCTYDPEEAGAIVDAKREEGLEFETLTILHNAGSTHEAIAGRVAEDIQAATGITVDTRQEPLQEFVQVLRAGEMEIFRLGWQADYPSPGSYLYPLFSGERKGIDNLTRYDVPEVNDLLSEARETVDPRRRLDLYHEAEDRILEDVAIAPILFYRHNKVVAPGVRDFTYTPMGTVDLARVWLGTE